LEINRSRSIFNLDFSLIITAFLLMVIGVLFVYSSSYNPQTGLVGDEYIRQIIWAILGLSFILMIAFINYNLYYDFAFFLYVFSIILLVFTLLFGRIVNNSKSWLGIFGLGIQPSEFAKITYIIFLSYFYSSRKAEIKKLTTFLLSLIITFVPVFLILRQPDFGTSLVFIPIYFAVSFINGVPSSYLIFFGSISFLSVILGVLPLYFQRIVGETTFIVPILTDINIQIIIISFLIGILILVTIGHFWLKLPIYKKILFYVSILFLSYIGSIEFRAFLKEYQIMRFITFLNPNIDPKGAGWNIIQSLNAVGSGGFWGKGYLQGQQSQLRYIPMQNTDFIFSIIAEEWGFLGGIFVTILYMILLIRAYITFKRSNNLFGHSLAVGIMTFFWFHFTLNVGMNIGIMPITGIPLLFISYGGSSLIAASIGVGILLNIQRRRFLF